MFFSFRTWRAVAAAALLAVGLMEPAAAQLRIANTRHNLSVSNTSSPTRVKATAETETCVFCHTPHAANATAHTPLWNRNTSGNAYTVYKSASLDADKVGGFLPQPAGSSLMCLSCHDGTVALGNIRVKAGNRHADVSTVNANTIGLNGTNPAGFTDTTYVGATTVTGGMPAGSAAGTAVLAATTGFTRLLGTNLENDHPISVTYDANLVLRDKELRTMDGSQKYTEGATTVVGLRSRTSRPLLPLLPTGPGGTGQVQCATCHDPHIAKDKFLRLNRLQSASPTGGGFKEATDIMCLACHDKGGTEWSNSVHANDTTAGYAYEPNAATLREFPAGTMVWQAACLNCHDTHTVAGARRLLREGVATANSSTSVAKTGGKSAIEETCYQCHSAVNPTSGTKTNVLNVTAILTATSGVPDIKTEFTTRAVRMPITKTTDEVHDITDANFSESPDSLGKTITANRHVECTDCHNPHRVIKNSRYDGTGSATQRTHVAGGTQNSTVKGSDGNIASGTLRGIWGVEPIYGTVAADPWPPQGLTYDVVKGMPGKDPSPLTKEYQLCFKCHSNYSNTEGSFPSLGHTGGTASASANGLTKYTNVAAEFAVNANDALGGADQGEYGESTDAGNEDGIAPGPADVGDVNNTDIMTDAAGTQNHRSWHPVMKPTGRTRDERRMQATGGNFRGPFGGYVGYQTMHCSDCHGSEVSWNSSSLVPDLTKVQGPHGSANPFLLKGTWSTGTTIGGSGLCFNCHNPTPGSTQGSGDHLAGPSGFNNINGSDDSGHGNAHGSKPCMRCHIALPHGWRNKAFLANLNCVGKEIGRTTNCERADANSHTSRLTAEPYYNTAGLRVKTWRASGNWTEGSCGGSQTGKDWMTSTC